MPPPRTRPRAYSSSRRAPRPVPVGRESAAAQREVRRVRRDEVKGAGAEKAPVIAYVAAEHFAPAAESVPFHVLPRKLRRGRHYLKPGHMELLRAAEQQERRDTRGAAEVYSPLRAVYISKVGKQDRIRTQSEMLRLGKKRPSRPQFVKFRHFLSIKRPNGRWHAPSPAGSSVKSIVSLLRQ